jgi:hypothetical protein
VADGGILKAAQMGDGDDRCFDLGNFHASLPPRLVKAAAPSDQFRYRFVRFPGTILAQISQMPSGVSAAWPLKPMAPRYPSIGRQAQVG